MQAPEVRVPKLGEFALGTGWTDLKTYVVFLYDSDARRHIKVTLPNPHGFADEPDEDRDVFVPAEKAAAVLAKHIDSLPDGNLAIEIDEAGKLLSVSTGPRQPDCRRDHYSLLGQYQLPPPVAARTVLRSELTEIRRLTTSVDVVAYPPSLSPPSGQANKNRYLFKYATGESALLWKEIQILARLAPHPNMALLDRLVLDERGGSRVVGFTTRYVPSDPLQKSRVRFKLKWLRQLMQAVDDLNLKRGIIHQDVAGRNLLVDPETDSIVLIDFDTACRAGVKKKPGEGEGKWGERDDVKGVLVFLYEYITRDPALDGYFLHLVDEKELWDPAKWIKHPDVELDDDVAEFYFEVMAWVRHRCRGGKQITRYTQAPEYFDWPTRPKVDQEYRLEWERPRSRKLDPTRRLLATGRYADEEAADTGNTDPNNKVAKPNGCRATPSPADPPVAVAEEAPGSGSGRKLRARQVNPCKRKQGKEGADAEVGAPSRKRVSRHSSPALPGKGCE